MQLEPQPGSASEQVSGPIRSQEAEAGYMLVAVVVMVALVLIALSVAAPVIAKDVRRDKEVETEQRAQQYVRAIRLYYRKFHNYPPSIDALKQSNNIRFLRQEYTDPLTGKADWKIIHLGEQKTTIKGFFGQELAGIAAGGLGSSIGSGLGSAAGMNSGIGTSPGAAASPAAAGTGSTPGASSTIGTTSPLTSGFQGATIGGAGTTTTGGTTTGGTGTGLDSAGGGGAIVGVAPGASGGSILTPNQQTSYETWEFWYDPRIEQLYQKGRMNAGMGGGTLGSQPASSFGTNLNGQPNSGTAPTTTAPGSTTPGTTTTPSTPTTPQ